MSEFKALDGGKPFIQPESPFFLLTEDVEGSGERIIYAIEISSCRDVEIPLEYTVEDFIEKINEVYEEA